MASTSAQPLPVTAGSPELHQKYAEERNKRLRSDGVSQFIALNKSPTFSYLLDDPWVDHDALNAVEPALVDGSQCKFLILGTGISGLLFAVRLIEAGFSVEDIRMIDTAGGFGGTWYWNRYPGLMCDIESYIYLPLLEETGYMPKHKYSYGPEIREHAERIADKWNLRNKTLFRAQLLGQRWDESQKHWTVNIRAHRGPNQEDREFHVQAQFVILAGGPINIPHIPKVSGLAEFEGSHFHTARWNYEVTGGSPDDPALTNLKEKTVAVIGTGATAIQVVPAVAKWAKHLYLFQRTPSSCDHRGQHETDPTQWSKIACKKGWQRARAENFNSYLAGAPDGEDLVQDGWTALRSHQAVMGSPRKGIVAPEQIEEHIAELNTLDLPRTERVRRRTAELVHDEATAEKLKAWHQTWCKRPTWSDEYLQAFNKPNVTLVDTDGRGIDQVTKRGIVFDGVEYPVDVLVLSTGYHTSAANCPGSPSGVTVIGRSGSTLLTKWTERGPTTFHGVATNDFPNCFFYISAQTGLGPNFTYVLDTVAHHVAYIIHEAHKRAGSDRFLVQPSAQAEEEWANEVVKRSTWFSALINCTPGFLNGEGEAARDKSESEKLKGARGTPWGEGMASYVEWIESWEKAGTMKGFEICT